MDQAKAGGFPRTGMAGEKDKLSLWNMQGDVLQCGPGSRVHFVDVKEFDHRAFGGMDLRISSMSKLPLASGGVKAIPHEERSQFNGLLG